MFEPKARFAKRALLCASTILIFMISAKAQTPSPGENPYRNFVGSWSGTILENTDKMPKTVTLDITEDKNENSMRWDYVFGVKGEKGYTHATKWVVLKPSEARLLMHWKGKPEEQFGTHALDTFAQSGFGRFIAEAEWKNKSSTSSTFNRVTFELHPHNLTYLWEVSSDDRRSFSSYSRFEFKRDGDQNHPSTAISESKE